MTNKEQNNKITVIIKTCNCENTLCDVLESVKDLDEIIVIDEHSIDDTVEIAKEYKAKIIFADKNDFSTGLNQALEESVGGWIFALEDDEIVPQKLIFELQNYVENPKKNRFCVSLSKKTLYLKKEIKSLRTRKELKLFKKGYAEFANDYSLDLKLKQGKIYSINKNFKIQKFSLVKSIKKDINELIKEIIEKDKIEIKNIISKKSSLFIKPALSFISFYFFKKAFLDGKRGFIFAKLKYIEEFILQNMIFERENNDF